MKYTESNLEEATLEWFEELGYQIIGGPDIDPESEKPERKDFSQVILADRLHSAIAKINPEVPFEAQEEAAKKVENATHSSNQLVISNRNFHKMLTDGVDVEYRRPDGSIAGDKVWLVDRKNMKNNDWLVVNQYTIIENKERRPDVVVFINGLPIAVFELKNLADEKVTVKDAFNQIQTYKNDIPSLFTYNELSIISDGHDARVGTVTSEMDRFMRWRTIDGEEVASDDIPQLEVLIRGMFDKTRLLDILFHFVVFDEGKEKIDKKIAAYHQYHATNKAIEKTLKATSASGDQRGGVVWHTQGSGKSLTMVFYTGKLVEVLDNPTIVVLTDRNDLDDQLFKTFSRCSELLRQEPKQAKSRRHLRDLLRVTAGGVVFTTIQKFLEKGFLDKYLLSDRRNIVVIADEAHRSQYDFIDGYARHMHEALPAATFIGFTGTPIELSDKSTRAVFGDYVDIYDISQAVEDKTTVPIYYEARLAKIELLESERPKIDPEFEELTEGEEVEMKEKLKSKWARLEAMVGSEKRIKLIAEDLVKHFEDRMAVIEGKGMIVAMSRRIAVELYDELIKLRPDWEDKNDSKGFLKVVMTGSAADPQNYQPHIRNKESLEKLADRMRDPNTDLKLVIVRDMWLTGFDVPSMHTMYIDKPMKGHGLMQAIARVNRVYKDKQGGLVVDYLGIAPQLKEALANYTELDQEETAIPQEEAVSAMIEKYEIVKAMYHDFDYHDYFKVSSGRKTQIIAEAMNFILGMEDEGKRYRKAVVELSQAFSLAVPHDKALEIRDEVAFFQAVKAGIAKSPAIVSGPTEEDYDHAIKQIVSSAVTSTEVVDIFTAAGLDKPNVAILSDEFLEEIRGLERKNLALEALKKLLNDQIKSIARKNVVKSRSFLALLEQTIRKYQNRTIETAQVIAELINLAKEIRKEVEKGKELGLSDTEVAFYDALADNESAITELGDKTLKLIAQELVKMLRENTTIDWTLRESVRAKIRIAVKKLLKKYNYPPDKQEGATQLVLLQAETVCKDWAGN
ncbi:MAG: type I site-specific deoxyribonuclease, HsdR family [Candidatus Berkelbacteria bacterium Licking1014_7]|uniref:Type I restriction enzyme endonuclease subunit n=1 Tax=Candidatus Berkelbacteria bacterium Licking1014_7 TaxID=2017147 RepID=A0A554LII5_9BACT|nr:MAG: type I site-specific deoxyribonuclease, HsdR family [Candidatus Berkelbacteria bacterium Licking1014_7]